MNVLCSFLQFFSHFAAENGKLLSCSGMLTLKQALLLLSAWFLLACNSHKIYISPQVGLTAPYKTLPFRTDSTTLQLSANAQLITGNANYDASDAVTAVNGYTQIAKRWGFLVVHANVGATLGNYHVFRLRDDRDYDVLVSPAYNEQIRGNYFFGAASGSAGFSLTAIGNKQIEWRPIAANISANKEFGSYAKLRSQMDMTKVTHVTRSPFLATVGVESEIIFRSNDWSLGFLMGQQWLLGKHYAHTWETYSTGNVYYNRGGRQRFFYSTVAVSQKHHTFYGSMMLGNRFSGVQIGYNRVLKGWR